MDKNSDPKHSGLDVFLCWNRVEKDQSGAGTASVYHRMGRFGFPWKGAMVWAVVLAAMIPILVRRPASDGPKRYPSTLSGDWREVGFANTLHLGSDTVATWKHGQNDANYGIFYWYVLGRELCLVVPSEVDDVPASCSDYEQHGSSFVLDSEIIGSRWRVPSGAYERVHLPTEVGH